MKAVRTFATLLALSLLCSTPVSAKKLYRYQDENGRWHFSDTPPNTDAEVTVERLKVHERDRNVMVTRTGDKKKFTFQVNNLYPGPVQIEFQLVNPRNVSTEPELPRSFIIPGETKLDVFSVTARDKSQRWGFSYRYEFVPGTPEARHQAEQYYNLPYPRGKRFHISQGFNGPYSHHTPGSIYAVDFAMPDGTPVHAARGGIVMDVARDFYSGGVDRKKYGARANFVQILHDDGSFGLYAHLRWESVLVTPGDRVRRGQVIAKSGNTGYSSGPHLHFAVQINGGMHWCPYRLSSRWLISSIRWYHNRGMR